jgi:gluconokinase
MPEKRTPALVVMGVTGCGKTSVAKALSERIRVRMIEGDAFHPMQNIQKMKAGIPLTDADRQGWLENLGKELAAAAHADDSVVLACSALKRRYRDTLRAAAPGLGFVFLQLSLEEARHRVTRRAGHFMPASLVDSQFRDLEPPVDEPLVLAMDATRPLHALVDEAACWWLSESASPPDDGMGL